jgi:hypothetical protein
MTMNTTFGYDTYSAYTFAARGDDIDAQVLTLSETDALNNPRLVLLDNQAGTSIFHNRSLCHSTGALQRPIIIDGINGDGLTITEGGVLGTCAQ